MASTRSFAVVIVLGACSSACALFFGLDGYGPGDGDPAARADGAADAPNATDGGSGLADGGGGGVTSYYDVVMQDGPIAYFRFEEQSGTSCKNEVAESPVQCTYTTGPFTLGAPGISGSSVNLGSTEARIDITIPSPLNGTTPFSVEAWVNVHGFGSSLVRNAVDSSTSTRTGQWVYWDTQKRIVTETWSEGTHLFYTTSSSPQPLGEFVHIVYMYSDTEEQDVLYVDGVRGVGERLSDKVPTQLKMSLVWGGFTGLLDEVALYRKVLSPERIAAHYAARSNR